MNEPEMIYFKPVPKEDGSIEFIPTNEPQPLPPPPGPVEYPYFIKRMKQYPQLADQLDMLWHAMDDDPSKRLEPFYSAIKAVKDQFPKPV